MRGPWWKIVAIGSALAFCALVAGVLFLNEGGSDMQTASAPSMAAPPDDFAAGDAAPDIDSSYQGDGEWGSADDVGSDEVGAGEIPDGEYGSADDYNGEYGGETGGEYGDAYGEWGSADDEESSGEYGEWGDGGDFDDTASADVGSGEPYSTDFGSYDPYADQPGAPAPSNAPPVIDESWGDLKSGGGGPGISADGYPSGLGSGATGGNPALGDPMAEIDRKLAQLPLGNIAFNTPEVIGLDETATIELLVSMREAEEALREAVRGTGAVESARVKLSNRMEARLSGMNFRIEAITPEQQVISGSERTEWRWQIEPTKSDKLELHLTLSALLTVDGEPTARAIRTFEKTIEVDVPFGQQIANATFQHIELITSALLVPIVGGAYRHYRRRKRRALAAPTDTPARRAA